MNPLNLTITVHPLAEKFPEIPPKEYEELKQSIKEIGLINPIVINDKGQILVGRNRWRAC
jgi:ParB-like chromosome segregation protein Spo0J